MNQQPTVLIEFSAIEEENKMAAALEPQLRQMSDFGVDKVFASACFVGSSARPQSGVCQPILADLDWLSDQEVNQLHVTAPAILSF